MRFKLKKLMTKRSKSMIYKGYREIVQIDYQIKSPKRSLVYQIKRFKKEMREMGWGAGREECSWF